MGIVREMIRDFVYGPPSLADLNGRAFNPGTVAVDSSTLTFGVDPAEWAPQQYGDYLATSLPVYTVIKKRATYLSSLPLVLSRLKADGSAEPVNRGALYDLTRKVNPWWTWRRLIEMTEMSLGLWGSAYWFLEKQGGVPVQLYWARPDRVRVVPHRTDYVTRFEYYPVSGMEPIRFAPDETIWLRYPNPLDEYSGLSPLAAARLSADTHSSAMKQNYKIFENGIAIGGLVTPENNMPMGNDAALEIVQNLKDRAKGTANAHRWLVLKHAAKFQPMSMSPKDAEFVALHKLTLEDICRVYGVPIDLVGGQRTFENYDAAVVSMWADTIIPEAAFLADEITEQLLPMFATAGRDRVDQVEFAHSGVKALQDDEEVEWRIAQGKLQSGVMTINEYRARHDEGDVPWGEQVWWGSVALTPIKDAEAPEMPEIASDGEAEGEETGDNDESPANAEERARGAGFRPQVRMAYGSEEHERLWTRFVQQTEPHERRVGRVAKQLFRQQEQGILTELSKLERAALPEDTDPESLLETLFRLGRWVNRFRIVMRDAGLRPVVMAAGQTALDEVTVGGSFDVSDPLVVRFLQRRAQRFAEEVNATTWQMLKDALSEGLEAGEGTDVLKKRVRAVMGDRIRSSEETIARTETIGAYNGGALEGARQSGVVESKTWLAALDDRTRGTHVAAHGQTVGLDANFTVGGASGPAPGQIGKASEEINCRCSMLFGLKPLGDT